MKIFKITILAIMLLTKLFANEPYIIGYYPSYRTSTYPPSVIPLDKITHIVHSFMWPDADGNLVTPNNFFDITPELVSTAHNKGAKVIISLGGGGNGTHFSGVLADSTKREYFIENIVDICIYYSYDGIDIDWEQPESIQDKKNLNIFVIELTKYIEEWEAELTISIAVPASNWRGQFYDATTLKDYVSWFGVMTYDFYGSWSTKSGFNSSLYKDPADPQTLTVDSAIREYWHNTKKVPYNKLVSGIPFYGYQFNGASGPYESFSTTTALTYKSILWLTSYEHNWSMTAKVPYLVPSDNGGSFISYDDTVSVRNKCEYAIEKELAGVMIWELAQTHISIDNQPLLETVIREMGKTTTIDKNTISELPTKFNISQNYPNPFNPSTNFNITIPNNSNLTIKIYDIRGNLVENIYNDFITKGMHNFIWNIENKNLSAGIYFLNIQYQNISKTIKMMYVK